MSNTSKLFVNDSAETQSSLKLKLTDSDIASRLMSLNLTLNSDELDRLQKELDDSLAKEQLESNSLNIISNELRAKRQLLKELNENFLKTTQMASEKVKNLEINLASSVEENQLKQQNIDELSSELRNLEIESGEIANRIIEMTQKIETVKETLSLLKKLEDIKERHSQLKNRRKTKKEKYEDKLDVLKEKLQEKKEKIDKLEHKLD